MRSLDRALAQWFVICSLMLWTACTAPLRGATAMILAGNEFGLPEDRPSLRLDAETSDSPFAAVGALEITTSGGRTFLGSAVAISSGWVLTAGHNIDLTDNGLPDAGLSVNFHLPGIGIHSVSAMHTHPRFTGFANPSLHFDLALLQLSAPLPTDLIHPLIGVTAGVGDVVTLVGFGRSGFGSYGYTTSASLVNRRTGENTLETISTNANGGQLFRYTFHDPDDPDSLGNDRETIIGPGDSGGPALVPWGEGHALVGVNTFVEGFGGRFGDIGGGVRLDPDSIDWIATTTGIPEPGVPALLVLSALLLFRRNRVSGGMECL